MDNKENNKEITRLDALAKDANALKTLTPTGDPRSWATPESVAQLESRIKKAAKAMQQCEKELTKAETKEETAKAHLEDAQFETVVAHAHLIAKAFVLGGELDVLDKQMAANKGKHGDTFRKRAIKLLGNKNAVYRPLAIYRYLSTHKGIASEEEAMQYAGDNDESYRDLAETARGALADKRTKQRAKSGETGDSK